MKAGGRVDGRDVFQQRRPRFVRERNADKHVLVAQKRYEVAICDAGQARARLVESGGHVRLECVAGQRHGQRPVDQDSGSKQ